MPNGRPRQRNTRAANRQRNIQRGSEVRAEPVQEAVVVQAEAVPEGRYYTNEEIAQLIQELGDRYDDDLQKENETLIEITIRQRKKIQEWKKQSVIREKKIIKGAVFEGYNLCHLARESGVVKPLQEGEFADATSKLSMVSPDEYIESIQRKYGD